MGNVKDSYSFHTDTKYLKTQNHESKCHKETFQ